MKKKKYLPLYYKWVKDGLPKKGLCYSLDHPPILDSGGLLCPNSNVGYWGYSGQAIMGYEVSGDMYKSVTRDFTPLRQNIVLLLAAMNNEL